MASDREDTVITRQSANLARFSKSRIIVVLALSAILVVGLYSVYTQTILLQEWKDYANELSVELDDTWVEIQYLESQNEKLDRSNTSLKSQNESLERSNTSLEYQNEKLDRSNTSLKSQNESLERSNTSLEYQNEKLDRSNTSLKSQIGVLNAKLNIKDVELRQYAEELLSTTERLDQAEILAQEYEILSKKPQTVISKTNVEWRLFDSKGNQYDWEMPVSTYEEFVKDDIPDYDEPVRNFALMVGTSFDGVIDDVYDNSNSNSDFIYEVWHIVSQLTVYDPDIGEYPRYALETLTRGGGDCEDLAILIAEMLKSSAHTGDWTIQLVGIDSKNPTDYQKLDHVIVYVVDGEYGYHIEATDSPSWDYYPNGVNGYFYDV